MSNPPAADLPPSAAELAAPPAWRTVDVLSDLHLHTEDAATQRAFARYLVATPADAIFLLGDIFEVWVGDDALDAPDSLESQWARRLHTASDRIALHLMHGNRDFLIGPRFAAAAGATLLRDPTVLALHGRRWLLTHGDALCIADVAYQRFRTTSRSAAWQRGFLARPLAERRRVAADLRAQSQAHQRAAATPTLDADPALSQAWLCAARADALVHGHTHRPACHALPGGAPRWVLSDWDLAAQPPRADVLRIDAHGATRIAWAG